MADELQSRGLCEGDDLLWWSEERNGGSGANYFGLARETPPDHSAHHPKPGSQTIPAIEMGKKLATAAEIGRGIFWLGKRDLSDENSRIPFGYSRDFAQACWNSISRNDEEDAIADGN